MFRSEPFYHSHIRRYVIVLGTLLNNIKIDRVNKETGNLEKRFLVPVSYGPGEKWIARLNQQTDDLKQTPAIVLPRISFEMLQMTYDGTRKIPSLEAYKKNKDLYEFLSANPPAPYNMIFTVTILSKYTEDGAKIIEQILPYFKPEWTSHVKLIDDIDLVMDIPVILNGVTSEELYEGQFEERRVIQWTLDMTMKGFFFGPTQEKKIIKFIDLNFYPEMPDKDPMSEEWNVRAGMTDDRKPTTDPSQSIAWQLIDFEDPWDFAIEKISIDDKFEEK